MKITSDNPRAVVEEAFWLAWQACGNPMGLGMLQDCAGATKEQVIENVAFAGDYPGPARAKAGEMHGDYVFGRMMKLRLEFDEHEIDISDEALSPDYQSWCGTYTSYESLVRAAIESTNAPQAQEQQEKAAELLAHVLTPSTTKIKLADSLEDVVFKMSEGNPGAVNVIMGIMGQGEQIDPDNMMGGLGAILFLDTLGIYGSKIYCLCADCCRKELPAMLTMLRAVQMGMYDGKQLVKDIDGPSGGRGVDLYETAQELCTKLQERMPMFNKGKPLGEESSDNATTGKEAGDGEGAVEQEPGDEQAGAGSSDTEAPAEKSTT